MKKMRKKKEISDIVSSNKKKKHGWQEITMNLFIYFF